MQLQIKKWAMTVDLSKQVTLNLCLYVRCVLFDKKYFVNVSCVFPWHCDQRCFVGKLLVEITKWAIFIYNSFAFFNSTAGALRHSRDNFCAEKKNHILGLTANFLPLISSCYMYEIHKTSLIRKLLFSRFFFWEKLKGA